MLVAVLGAQTVTVPFVGCPSDAHTGPIELPHGMSIQLPDAVNLQ